MTIWWWQSLYYCDFFNIFYERSTFRRVLFRSLDTISSKNFFYIKFCFSLFTLFGLTFRSPLSFPRRKEDRSGRVNTTHYFNCRFRDLNHPIIIGTFNPQSIPPTRLSTDCRSVKYGFQRWSTDRDLCLTLFCLESFPEWILGLAKCCAHCLYHRGAF